MIVFTPRSDDVVKISEPMEVFLMEDVKQFLEKHKIKQVEAAKEIGVHPALFNSVLNGWQKLPKKYLEKLKKFIEVKSKYECTGEFNIENLACEHEIKILPTQDQGPGTRYTEAECAKCKMRFHVYIMAGSGRKEQE